MEIAIAVLFGLVAALVAALYWHRLGDPVEEHESTKKERALEEFAKAYRNQQMKKRLSLLNKAYQLAKEELGEEPTIDQILLTRDQLITQQELEREEEEYGTT